MTKATFDYRGAWERKSRNHGTSEIAEKQMTAEHAEIAEKLWRPLLDKPEPDAV